MTGPAIEWAKNLRPGDAIAKPDGTKLLVRGVRRCPRQRGMFEVVIASGYTIHLPARKPIHIHRRSRENRSWLARKLERSEAKRLRAHPDGDRAISEAPEVKPTKADVAEERVKAALAKIMTEHEGDWDIAMDLISIRGFRDTLVRRRREIGMTQSELAQTLGIKQSSVSSFETRPWPDPHLSTLRRYARALGIMIHHDLTFEVPEVADTPVSDGPADE